MKCPLCKKGNLRSQPAKGLPKRLMCDHCSGHWIRYFDYWKWLNLLENSFKEKPVEEGESLFVVDSLGAKFCPDCHCFMSRYKVGHGIKFHLDRCATCGGVWFDKNEWEILKSRNLHDEIHFIFSHAWQKEVHQKEMHEMYENRITKILGESDFSKVKKFKEWLSHNDSQNTVMAFLANIDE